MFTNIITFTYLKEKSKSNFHNFKNINNINQDYNELPKNTTFSDLILSFECIDIRIFDENGENYFYRVKNNLYTKENNEVPIGAYTSVYDKEGLLIDELLDFYEL